MRNLLLKADVFANLMDMANDPSVIFAVFITAFGIMLAVMAGPLANFIKKKKVSTNDNTKITLKIVALVLILIGLVVMVIPSVGILING